MRPEIVSILKNSQMRFIRELLGKNCGNASCETRAVILLNKVLKVVENGI